MKHDDQAPPPEELVAHDDFVRDLALRLVNDRTDADDVTQDALLIGMRKAPSGSDAQRSWLAKVTRDLAIDLRRHRVHRTNRERTAARGELLPSAADLHERESVRRIVANAVLELPELYCKVLLLRFYDELPPRVIAKRLGLPVETVRTRIKRGLAALRSELCARHGGENLLGLLLPLLVPFGAYQRIARGLSPKRYWRRVRYAWLASPVAFLSSSAALFLAALGIAARMRATADSAQVEIARATRDATAELSSRSIAPDSPTRAPLSERMVLDAVATQSVRARLLRGDSDETAGGVRAVLSWDGHEETLRADDSGSIAFSAPVACDLALAFESSRRTARHAETFRVGGEHSDEELRFRLPAATTIRGEVLGADGQPRAFAEVLSWKGVTVMATDGAFPQPSDRTLCDAQGRFELMGVHDSFIVAARQRDQVARECLFARAGEYDLDREYPDARFVVDDTPRIAGRVTDAEGVAVPGARVHAYHSAVRTAFRPAASAGYFYSTRLHADAHTDERGEFALDTLSVRPFTVSVEADGYLQTQRNESDSGGSWNFELRRALPITVAVVDERGQPAPDAELGLILGRGEPRPLALDEQGVATLPLLQELDLVLLTATRRNGDAGWLGPLRASDLRKRRSRQVALSEVKELRGVVLSRDGTPIVGARLELLADDLPGAQDGLRCTLSLLACARHRGFASTDALGRFELRAPASSRETLTVTAPLAQNPSTYLHVDRAGGELTIELGSSTLADAQLELAVRDGRDGTPVAQFELSAFRALGRTNAMQIVEHVRSNDGRCTLLLPDRGPWNLGVTSEGYAFSLAPGLTAEGGRLRCELELWRKSAVSLRVLDCRGAPLAHGMLMVAARDASTRALCMSKAMFLDTAALDEHGRVTLFDVPAVALRVRVFAPGVHRPWEFEIDAARERERELALDGDFSSPREPVRIKLCSSHDGSPWQGRFELEANDSSGRRAASFHAQLAGSDLRIDPLARYTNVQADQDGALSNFDPTREVTWSTLSPRARARDLDAGEFEVDLPIEPCTLEIRAEGCEPAHAPLAVAASRPSVVRIELRLAK